MVVPVLLLTIGAAAVLFGRRKHPRRVPVPAGQQSPVAYQHLQLYQGGVIGQDALQNAKAELEEVLHRGGVQAAENALRPGLEYVVKVRALGEIGTDEAGRVLERQLSRRIANDPLEQAWYWIDLVQALRALNRSECLPTLFRCGDKAMETPLGYLFAAEVTAFPAFAEALHEPLSPMGQSAIRVFRAALEGIRKGYVPVTLYADAQVGEMLRRLAETCPDTADTRLTRIFIEALRHARRAYASSPELRDDPVRRQVIRWQVGQLRDAEPILREYLHNIAQDLAARLPCCGEREQAEILAIIAELHADAGTALIDLLADPDFAPRAAAIECLQWSTHPEASWFLAEQGQTAIAGGVTKSAWWKRKQSPKPIASAELLAILKALRGHPGEQSEAVLREFGRHPQAMFRVAAIRSLGWWEPIDRSDVIHLLHAARIDSNPEVRMSAVAALARLGECAAIGLIQEGLGGSHVDSVHQTIDLIAGEGLTWLWPDLDLLTESDHPAVAHHAWEAIEELRELILGPMN